MRNQKHIERAATTGVPPPAQGSTFEWVVYSTALRERWLMLYCEKTLRTGTVRDPSKEELEAAFYAPSQPIAWTDNSRVWVDEETDENGDIAY